MPPRRQRLKVRQLLWVFAPATIALPGFTMMLAGFIFGPQSPGPDPWAAALLLFGFTLTLWGCLLGVILFVDSENYSYRLKAARRDRPRLYRRRGLGRKTGRQCGVEVTQDGQGIQIKVTHHEPPSRDPVFDLITLDFMAPWGRLGVAGSLYGQTVTDPTEARKAWTQADQKAREEERSFS